MSFNSLKFKHVLFSDKKYFNNIYLTPDCDIVEQLTYVKDLGIYMSEDCSFFSHIVYAGNVSKQLSGWILGLSHTVSRHTYGEAF